MTLDELRAERERIDREIAEAERAEMTPGRVAFSAFQLAHSPGERVPQLEPHRLPWWEAAAAAVLAHARVDVDALRARVQELHEYNLELADENARLRGNECGLSAAIAKLTARIAELESQLVSRDDRIVALEGRIERAAVLSDLARDHLAALTDPDRPIAIGDRTGFHGESYVVVGVICSSPPEFVLYDINRCYKFGTSDEATVRRGRIAKGAT